MTRSTRWQPGSGRSRTARCAGAPHTAADLVGDWERVYSREMAVFPCGIRPDKYWPPVGRIEQAHGDRNLICTCPPPSAFES